MVDLSRDNQSISSTDADSFAGAPETLRIRFGIWSYVIERRLVMIQQINLCLAAEKQSDNVIVGITTIWVVKGIFRPHLAALGDVLSLMRQSVGNDTLYRLRLILWMTLSLCSEPLQNHFQRSSANAMPKTT